MTKSKLERIRNLKEFLKGKKKLDSNVEMVINDYMESTGLHETGHSSDPENPEDMDCRSSDLKESD